MKPRLTAIILAGGLALSNVAVAQATEQPSVNGAQVAFQMPINGYVGGKKTTQGADTKFEIWQPLSESDQVAITAPDTVPTLPPAVVTDSDAGVIVIDNDEVPIQELQETYNWEEVPDETGKTRIKAGACFPVSISSELTSKSAKVGDPVQGRLKVDLKIGGKVIAKKGDLVTGHVSSAAKARRILHAELSTKRWMRANGCLGIQFDEIVTETGEHLPVIAKPAQRARIVANKAEGRVLGVNHNGEVATPLSIQLKHQALHLAIRGGASAAGVFSFGAVPLAYGVVGAINPSFAFLHPVGKNVPHRRLKGFAMGVASGVPGGFLIADSIIKGLEATIKPGDEFLAEIKQDWTGEAATDAEMLGGATTKVQGQILQEGDKKKKDSK